MEIFYNNQWLEVLGCGVMQQSILDSNGCADKVGWAFGIGLERIAMVRVLGLPEVLFDIADIRLFWSQDPRFLSQFSDGIVKRFLPFSKYPACYKDVEVVRDICGDLVEQVSLIDTFEKKGRVSRCYRVSYRSMERREKNAKKRHKVDTKLMGERKTPIKSILEAATDSIFGGASSRYLLPNPKRKVEAFFTQWMLFEGQNVVKSELEKIDVNLALESQGVIECLAGVVAELDMPDASASPALVSADSQTVPPKSPSRRRKHSGSDAEMSDGKSKEAEIPLFYFPHGKPALDDKAVDWRTNIAALFGWSSISEGKKLLERDFLHVTVALGLSRYLNSSLFQKVSVGSDSVTFPMFQAYWESLSKYHHSDHSLAFAIMKQPQNNYLLASDVAVTTQDVIQNHPGLEFLSSLPVFQNRYMETVVTRLFYSKQHNWRKEMTLQEFKKSQFYECLLNLEKVEDVNATQDIFSYQHFYVIYCKFWELDRDHDMLINLPSLLRYDNGAMTPAILSRVMQGCGKPLAKGPKSAIMTYEDFIWFILSVEDKKTPQSIEYWFRCLDIDGDGVISLYELQQFYEDQYDRMMISRVSDVWKLEDFICSL
ncbi:Serine/threonine-protein phosphatase 2A regulatory subunit B'' subunit alpha [Kappamyces sp. JEL0680]|nr:Serine/threonine-protein phosphatase 2A regulatory subunit B'' subunit alpha [Kappamyces sp. JEL0680]